MLIAAAAESDVGSLRASRNWVFTTMAIYDDKWFEIWYVDGVDVTPSHLPIVTPNPKSACQMLIIDPFEKGKIILEAKDYEAATAWLGEDEYQLLGRQFPDDGKPCS